MSRPDPRHRPFTVEATLASPVVTTHPILLDGILHFAAASAVGARAPGGWAGDAEVGALRLPLARCHHHELWWYAASQATPFGREEKHYLHRRPATDAATRWTNARSIGIGGGPDKALRVPVFRRLQMRRLCWTGYGDPDEVARLLQWVPGIGDNSTHGHGWVQRWDVRRGGPPFLAYMEDLRLRHLPAQLVGDDIRWTGRVARKLLPLTPPYHERARAVAVAQVVEV